MQRASPNRSTTARWISTWRANTTSGSPDARKSSIQASAAASLPAAARRWSSPSWASRSARSVVAIRALSSDRSSGCVRSHSITSRSASRYSSVLVSDTGTTTWRLGGSCGSTSALSRRTKQTRRRCQCSRSSDCIPRKRLEKRAPDPKSDSRSITRSCAISSSAWFKTGVPVSASRRPATGTVAASARTAWVRFARGFLQ